MLKQEFINLPLKKQVEYINSQLSFKTLTMACNEIGVPRSTLAGKFKKKGYKLNLTQNKYILEGQNSQTENSTENNSNNDIKELLKMKDRIKALIEWFDKEQNEAAKREFNIQLDKFEGEAVSRTFVLYPNVLERYLEFCESHRAYRRQDIISKALTEFLDRYE